MPEYVIFKDYTLNEFFKDIKGKTGLSHKKLSNFLKLSKSMINHYIKNRCKLKYKYFQKLCRFANISQNKYSFDIKEFKERYDIKIPKPNQNLAEFIGTMLGDGNLCKPNSSRNFYFLRIGNHTIDDKEYRDYLQKLFFSLFKINLRSYDYPHTETMLDCSNRIVFEIIEKYGFPRGNKKKNNVKIPKWIMSNNKYLKACIRGLIDTDGTVFPKSRNKKLPQIEISSAIPNLREDIRNGLIKLGFKPSNWSKFKPSGWSKGSSVSNCGLYAKDQVLKFYKEIGFSNPKHTKKFINILDNNSCEASVV